MRWRRRYRRIRGPEVTVIRPSLYTWKRVHEAGHCAALLLAANCTTARNELAIFRREGFNERAGRLRVVRSGTARLTASVLIG
jgi:hypothetical protein